MQPEQWQDVMKDIERVIMPGVTHWHSPKFHAYFPTANSYPAIVADMLSGAIACIGFTWVRCKINENIVFNKKLINFSIPDCQSSMYRARSCYARLVG